MVQKCCSLIAQAVSRDSPDGLSPRGLTVAFRDRSVKRQGPWAGIRAVGSWLRQALPGSGAPTLGKSRRGHRSQAKRVVQLAIGEQAAVRSDLSTVELELDPAVEGRSSVDAQPFEDLQRPAL